MTVRRLAAVLAADVAGYSRLMGVDEAGTLARLKLLRSDHVEPGLRRHNGRLVGEAGDSLLVEFASAVDAVTCAAELQNKLAVLNADLPEDRRMRFRMGINLGEIIADGATIHGDGVNVAARLEKLAEPGSIAIARVVHDQIKGKVPFGFDDLGEQTLRNIAEPVRAYRIVTRDAYTEEAARAIPREVKATVAVLPFANMSGDPEQEYFSDGITEDLITALAKFRHLAVVSRNSTFVYKGRSAKVQDIGRELGADYVVEGSVRKGGSRVRVTAQLIDAATGAHLWAERFDRDLTDIFAVQDEIVTMIAAQLNFSLVDAAAVHRRGGSDASLTAYDHFLRGRAAWRRGDAIETRDHYLKAVEVDPRHAPGLAALAFMFAEDRWMGLFGLSIDEEELLSRHYADRALAANDGDPMVHQMLGTAFLTLGELDKAKHHLSLAVSLNPYFPYSIINLGCTLAFMGRYDEGLAMVERGFWLEPRIAPAMQAVPFFIHYMKHDYDRAIDDFQRFDDPYAYLFLILAACHAHAEHADEARGAVANFEARRPAGFDIEGFVEVSCRICRLPEDKEHWREGFRKAGLIP